MKALILLLISLAVMASACTSSQTGGGALTVPSQWKLVSFGRSGAETPVIDGSSITLEFAADGKVGGNGGCNSYGGGYETQGNTLAFKEIISTLRACLDDKVTQQEGQYLQALQTATRFEITGNNLTIWYDGGQSKLNFVKQL